MLGERVEPKKGSDRGGPILGILRGKQNPPVKKYFGRYLELIYRGGARDKNRKGRKIPFN